MEKVKLLVTGPVCNELTSFTSKLSTLQKSKAGPFHACFCVGPFFGNKANQKQSDNIKEDDLRYQQAKELLTNGAPLPVYFCDLGLLPQGIYLPVNEEKVKDEAEISLDDDLVRENDEADTSKKKDGSFNLPKEIVKIATNVYHLRGIPYQSSQTADILNIMLPHDEKTYLTVAFLPPNVRMGSTLTANLESKTKHPSFVGCDILLTSEWGQGMAGSSCLSGQDKINIQKSVDAHYDLNEIGSYDVAEAASICRPRYHFAPSAISNGQTDGGYEASFFLQSSPYTNPPSALSSGVMKKYHTSRFLALCQVVDSKKAKEGGKVKKFIHALGLQPLWSMDRVTATAIPDNTPVMSCPYTDDGYGKDNVHESNNLQNFGLSEAQTRRILCEENTSDQYRWKIQNRKRPLEDTSTQILDPSNSTLFLYGLQNDISRGENLNRGIIFQAFQGFGCTRVRYPGNDRDTAVNGRPHSYCFLHFQTHEEASECLVKTSGVVEIAGIVLSLKWSANKNRNQGSVPPPPPIGFQGIMMPSEGKDQPTQKRQKTGLTESEASDSSSLFVHLRPIGSLGQYNEEITKLSEIAQTALEDAINGDENGERVTAAEEPALKVTSRSLSTKPHCGFLMFASHAAASMALATLTGSTDGGDLLEDFHQNKDLLQGAQLWWGKNTAQEPTGKTLEHHPLDSRTDCWFCLASSTCEKHLIVNLCQSCYVTMPKGPVNKHHTLIVPINHSSSEHSDGTKKSQIIGAFLDPDSTIVAEIDETKDKIRRHAKTKLQRDLFVFERAIPTKKGYHSHVNCIPIEKGLGAKLRTIMLSMGAAPSKYGLGFDLVEIQNPDIKVHTILKNSDDLDGYFYAEIPVDDSDEIKRYLYKYNANDSETKFVPLQFGREVLASVLGDPKVASWKECLLTKEQEEEFTAEYRESFQAF